MQNPLFSQIEDDIYVRQYTLPPAQFNGRKVVVYAECTPNAKKINGHEYMLTIFIPVDEYLDREFLVGVTLGETKLDKSSLDLHINGWIAHFVGDEGISQDIEDYLKKEELFEEWCEEKLQNPPNE